MADALARAIEDKPDCVIDVATLTGAQITALGDRVAGVMGTPPVRDEVVACAAGVGEAFWPMPLPEHLRSALETPFAGLRNADISSRGRRNARSGALPARVRGRCAVGPPRHRRPGLQRGSRPGERRPSAGRGPASPRCWPFSATAAGGHPASRSDR